MGILKIHSSAPNGGQEQASTIRTVCTVKTSCMKVGNAYFSRLSARTIARRPPRKGRAKGAQPNAPPKLNLFDVYKGENPGGS